LRRLAGFSVGFCLVRGLTGSSLPRGNAEPYQSPRKNVQRMIMVVDRGCPAYHNIN
jgi:hypothetical protein